ncbi:MAG: PAS domain S-box protein [Capsulimonadales bacterium]|nr:PAS domain S-box protein [Capsulimonadales bacterium]
MSHASPAPERDHSAPADERRFVSEMLTIPPLAEIESVPAAPEFIRLLEASGQMVIAFNDRWEYLYLSPGVAALVGKSPEEMIGFDVFALFPETERSPFFRYPMQAMAEQVALRFEALSPVVDRWFEGQAVPMMSGGLLLLLRDITERKREEERLRLLEAAIVHANDAIMITDMGASGERHGEEKALEPQGPRIIYVNPAFSRLTGYLPEEAVGRSPRFLQGPNSAEPTRRYMRNKLAAQEPFRAEILNYRRDRSTFWTDINVHPVMNEFGFSTHWVAIQRDITERKQYEEALRRSESYLHQVIDSSPNAILTLDMEGHLLSANRRGMEMLETDSLADIIYTFWLEYWSVDDQSTVETALREAMQGRTCRMQGQGRTRRGAFRWWEMITAPLASGRAEALQVMVVVTDITEQRHLEIERERLFQDAVERADRDSLTGLWNHRAFNRQMLRITESLPPGVPYALLVLDVNNFKFFNDAYGHMYGDEVLILVADTLRASVRGNDLVGRMGGDEFAILLPRMPRVAVDRYIERLRMRIGKLGFSPPGGNNSVPLELSIGVASFPEDAASGTELFRIADERCLRNKLGTPDTLIADLYETLRATVQGFTVLDALVTSVDNKDRYTRRHSEEVVLYSLVIADELQVPETLRQALMKAALVHDVGKIGVPDRILRHPGQLSAGERELMQRHTQMGEILVRSAGGLDDTLDAVLYHHEAWDGSGYPQGLAGEAIPLSARILSVADAFSAMTTNRPYRKGLSEESALELLRRGAGTQWDEVCVRAFIRGRQRQKTALKPVNR